MTSDIAYLIADRATIARALASSTTDARAAVLGVVADKVRALVPASAHYAFVQLIADTTEAILADLRRPATLAA